MPKKTRFIEDYQSRISNFIRVTKVVVAVKLPTGAIEIIINTDEISSKFDYYCQAYDEHMQLKTNPMISIVGWMFV